MGEHGAAAARVTDVPRLPPRRPESHKGDFGRILLVAGSPSMTGAAFLAAEGAVRAGAGLVTLGTSLRAHPLLAGRAVAFMTLPLPETRAGTVGLSARKPILQFLEGADAAAIGPGLSRVPETARLCARLVQEIPKPLVVDADALSAIAGKARALRRNQTGPRVLTPHPGEFAALTGRSVGEVQADREGLATAFAREHGVVLVLKGHRTVVADGDRIFVNETGNPGMATGGSGDVLTGVLAALLGQGLPPFDAARLGVHVHGLAGDLARDQVSEISLSAADVLDSLPAAFRRLHGG